MPSEWNDYRDALTELGQARRATYQPYRLGPDDEFVASVGRAMGVTLKAMKGRGGGRREVWARQVCCYLADQQGRTFEDIGVLMGRCKVAAWHNVQRVRVRVAADPFARAEVERVALAVRCGVGGPMTNAAGLAALKAVAAAVAGEDAERVAAELAAAAQDIARRVREGRAADAA